MHLSLCGLPHQFVSVFCINLPPVFLLARAVPLTRLSSKKQAQLADQILQEMRLNCQSAFMAVYEDYQTLKSHIQQYLLDPSNESAVKYLSSIEALQGKYKNHEEDLKIYADQSVKFCQLCESMLKQKC